MPSARTHDFITVVTGAAGVPFALGSGLPGMSPDSALALLGSYMVSGLLLSPDLDVRSTPYRRWRLLRWIWIPYQRLVPHRSWVSHSFLFGPLLRVLYFVGVVMLITAGVFAALQLIVPVDPTGLLRAPALAALRWVEVHPYVVTYAVVGLVLGGAAHTLADMVYTWLKRTF